MCVFKNKIISNIIIKPFLGFLSFTVVSTLLLSCYIPAVLKIQLFFRIIKHGLQTGNIHDNPQSSFLSKNSVN